MWRAGIVWTQSAGSYKRWHSTIGFRVQGADGGSRGEQVWVREEKGTLWYCLCVLVPLAFALVVTAEKVGPKVFSVLVHPVRSGVEGLVGSPEKQGLLPDLMLMSSNSLT